MNQPTLTNSIRSLLATASLTTASLATVCLLPSIARAQALSPGASTPLDVATPEVPEERPRAGYVNAGVGAPDLLHARAGLYVLPELSVDLAWSALLFESAAGVGASAYLFGDSGPNPPMNSLLVATDIRVSTADPLEFTRNEGMGPVIGTEVGYALHGREGFQMRLSVGALLLPWANRDPEEGWAYSSLAPQFKFGLGYAF